MDRNSEAWNDADEHDQAPEGREDSGYEMFLSSDLFSASIFMEAIGFVAE